MNRPDPNNTFDHILIRGALELGIQIDSNHVELFRRYATLLIEWGNKTNLTSIKSLDEIAVIHFLDSLTILKVWPSGIETFLDVGTGAGFPGMVLAVMRPGLKAHLLDKNVKKIVFLKHVAHELKLSGLTFHARDITDVLKRRSGHFDLVVSRALSCDPWFIDCLIRSVTKNGFLVLMTGPSRQSAVISPSMREADRWTGRLPFTGAARTVSLWQKIA